MTKITCQADGCEQTPTDRVDLPPLEVLFKKGGRLRLEIYTSLELCERHKDIEAINPVRRGR